MSCIWASLKLLCSEMLRWRISLWNRSRIARLSWFYNSCGPEFDGTLEKWYSRHENLVFYQVFALQQLKNLIHEAGLQTLGSWKTLQTVVSVFFIPESSQLVSSSGHPRILVATVKAVHYDPKTRLHFIEGASDSNISYCLVSLTHSPLSKFFLH